RRLPVQPAGLGHHRRDPLRRLRLQRHGRLTAAPPSPRPRKRRNTLALPLLRKNEKKERISCPVRNSALDLLVRQKASPGSAPMPDYIVGIVGYRPSEDGTQHAVYLDCTGRQFVVDGTG